MTQVIAPTTIKYTQGIVSSFILYTECSVSGVDESRKMRWAGESSMQNVTAKFTTVIKIAYQKIEDKRICGISKLTGKIR
jgi:hypothetical protein